MAIRRVSLREQVKDEILKRLAAGALEPGSSINEVQLASELNISRTPLREALIELQQDGVIVPRSALIRFGGKTWAYVQLAEGEFSRRELVGAKSVGTGWFAPQGFKSGQGVVTAGAQILLSEELKSQIQVGEEEMRKG